MKSFTLSLFIFCWTAISLFGQEKTIINDSWNIVGISVPVNDKLQLGLKPNMIRQNDYYKDYNRIFLDFTIKYKQSPQWSFQLLQRTVINNDANESIWFFFDVAHTHKETGHAFSIKNRLRFHFGTEALENDLVGDFLRYEFSFHHPLGEKTKMYFALEPFYQFNQKNELQRIRYELGLKRKLHPRWNLGLTMRREEAFPPTPNLGRNTIVSSLVYSFGKK